MTTIHKVITVDAQLETVWKNIADVGGISNLIGFLSNSVLDGNARTCTLAEGGTLKEKIVTIDENRKRIVYSITESPLNMEFHVAIMEVKPCDNGTEVSWTVDLLPDDASTHMTPMLDAACADMETTLAA